MNILALDTASYTSGYAVYKSGKISESGTIKLRSKKNTDHEQTQDRIGQLYDRVCNLISRHKITQLVAEDIYKDSDPRKATAVEVLGQCRGAIIAANVQYQLSPIKFINPLIVKREMWGYTSSRQIYRTMSRSDQKARMCRAVTQLGYQLKTNRNGTPDNDQADAIGLLITYLDDCGYMIDHPAPNKPNKPL